jgi:C-terminal peptidase (prc)
VSRALVPLLVLVALAAGITLGGHPDLLPGFVRDELVGDQDTRVVREAIEKIGADYYRKIPERTLADAAISGVVRSLGDRFSNYLSPKEYKRFQDVTDNAYAGVGMEVVKVKRGLRVVTAYDGSPAKRAGIERGDIIAGVNGATLAGTSSAKGSDRIKGPPGTEVTLSVRHDGKVREIKLKRARVTVPAVASRLRTVRGVKLGVVRLATFSSGAHGEVRDALEKLLSRGAKGFVFDLRGNGGGLVSEAQLIASAFLKDGPIVTTRGRAVETQTLKAIGKPVVPDLPVVVLVDHDSASASEIVAGALQDRHRATVVGLPTFGKGVFQQILELSNGGALDLTAGQYFTPSGKNLGGRGIKTGAGVKPDVRAFDVPRTRPDEALEKALAVLAGKLR